ncbi:MAG: HlyD family efflux transporter periplasmic adaptor subunit [Thermoanaerobaculaceae bacterium]|jgi:multidrug efflux pump subunit AcrA (membrane-fusion protein)|nr:HlyD family efflux transporter periplasmic adaptor subunit [Thermoanaerobaculaceae bacterium]
MRRRLVGAGVAVVATAAALLAGSRMLGQKDVPVLTVRPQRFHRAVAADGVLRAVRSTPITCPAELRQSLKIAWLLPDGTPVKAGDVVVRLDSTDAEKALKESEATVAQVDQRLAKSAAQAQATGRALEREAGLAARELENARSFQTTDEEIYSRFEIATSAIDTELAAKRKEHADAVLGARPGVAASELDLLRIERRRAEIERQRATQTLGQLEMRAPHDGLLLLSRGFRDSLPQVGDMVWPNDKVAEIPDLGSMEAEVWVLEVDAGGLTVGQAATVLVEGRPDAKVEAHVRHVDALAQPRQQGSQVQYFGAVLTIGRTDPTFMKPGMRVGAHIVVADRAEALVVPRQAVFEREGRRVVFRTRRWGGFEPAEVEMEAVAPERVIITRGLVAGDVIAAVDPEQAAVRATPPVTPGPVLGGAE